MKLEITSKYDYQEMCDELGISYESFISFINSGGKMPNSVVNEPLLLEVVNMYLEHLDTLLSFEQIAEKTRTTYQGLLLRLKRYISCHYKELTLDQFDQSIFLDFLMTVKAPRIEKLSKRTMNTYTAIIRELLDFACAKNLTEKEYKKRFNLRPVDLKPRYLREVEIVAFLKEALQRTHGYRYHAIFSFLLGTGCRVGEVSKLRVCDFDIENNVVRISNGKGGKDRNIPIYPEIKKIVLDYLNLTGVKEWSHHMQGYLFSRDFGTNRTHPISVRSIEKMVETICKKLNFSEHYTTHSFRHTFAVRCLMADMKIEYLSQIMGHKSPSTTYIYVQLFPKDLQAHVTEKYPFAFEKLMFTAFGRGDE